MKATLQSNKQHSDTSNSNYMILLFIIGYLLMDFLPSFKTIEKVSPQYLYLALLNIIIGVYCYFNTGMLSQNLIVIGKKSIVLKIYASFLFLSGVSMITAVNFSLAVVTFSKLLIVFCMFINITMLLYKRLDLLFQIAFLVAISLIVQSYIIFSEFFKTLDLSTIKGSTGNINILAASVNIKIPFLILGIAHFSNWKRAILTIALLFSTTLIFLTGSRAALVALALQVIVFLVFYIKVNKIKKTDFVKITCILLPIFISFAAANIIFSKAGNSDRYKSVGNRIEQIGLSDESSQLRLDLWKNAGTIIAQKPLLGVGIGNWKIADLPYENTLINDSDVSSNAHNDFLELAAETGILNGLIFVMLLGAVFIISIRKILKSNQKEIQLVALISLMLALVYGVDAFFNFPFYVPAMQLGFCFMLALVLVNEISAEEVKLHYSSSKIILRLVIISCLCLYFAFSQFKASQFEYKFKVYQATYRANNGLPETGRLLESSDIIASLPKFPTVSYYSEPFIEYAAESLFYEGKYDEALHYFKLAKKINAYLGNSDWYLHKIALTKGNVDEAYKQIKIAFGKRPRNKDFYLTSLFVANEKKDTLEMLKIHDQFSKYRTMPQNWINTSNALQQSGYSTKNLIVFIDKGLIVFPNDSLLLQRKASYGNLSRDNYLLIAQQYGALQQFDKAIEFYKKALKEDPGFSIAIQNIGICYSRLNQFKEAIYYLLKVEKSSELKDGKTEYLLGVCYLNIKDVEKGCAYLNIAKDKNFPGANELSKRYCK